MRYGVAWPVRYSILITEVSTPQRISRNSARILVSLNPWAVSVRALTMRWANRSTPPSNAKSSKTVAAGVMRPAAAARSSGGWPATTPNAATPTAAISAPSPLKGSTHPLRCPKLLNHKSVSTTWGQGPIFQSEVPVLVEVRDRRRRGFGVADAQIATRVDRGSQHLLAIAQLSRQPDRAAGIRAVLHLGPAVNRRVAVDRHTGSVRPASSHRRFSRVRPRGAL